MSTDLRVYVGPGDEAAVEQAVERAGARLASTGEANVFVWTDGRLDGLKEALHPGVSWVQLASAGVESAIELGLVDSTRRWTSATGLYGARVAEHAVALILAAAKRLPQAARRSEWQAARVDLLEGATVGVVGAGGIGLETLRRLEPFGLRRIALTRSGRRVGEADVWLGPDGLDRLLDESDYVVLAAPLTAETEHLVGRAELERIGPRGCLVNVARGRLVDTEALVDVLAAGLLGGACLDVVDPEPLPPGHPLWRFENVLITPHVANPWERHHELLAERVSENIARFREGSALLGSIDLDHGY